MPFRYLVIHDEKMIKAEVLVLAQRYDDLMGSSQTIEGEDATEENQKVEQIVKAATIRVEEVQARTRQILDEIQEEKGSVSSERSRGSCLFSRKKKADGSGIWHRNEDNRDVVSEGGKRKKRTPRLLWWSPQKNRHSQQN